MIDINKLKEDKLNFLYRNYSFFIFYNGESLILDFIRYINIIESADDIKTITDTKCPGSSVENNKKYFSTEIIDVTSNKIQVKYTNNKTGNTIIKTLPILSNTKERVELAIERNYPYPGKTLKVDKKYIEERLVDIIKIVYHQYIIDKFKSSDLFYVSIYREIKRHIDNSITDDIILRKYVELAIKSI